MALAARQTTRTGYTSFRASAVAAALLLVLALATSHLVAQEPAALQTAAALEQLLVSAIDKAGKSVVAIARVDPLEPARNGDRLQPRPRTPADPEFVPDHFGTGVIIDRGGFILTQNHVVAEKSIHYITTHEPKTYRARIIGADPRSDLAVLKIEANDLTPIRFGDTSKLKRGQIVIALGNPYAIARDGQASASWGIIANLSRKVPPATSEINAATKDKLYHFATLIQTDAKLNLGTSGGALVNLRGEMIGLTTSLAATAGFEQAAGYAIPVDDVFLRAVETLKSGKEVEYGYLGVWPETLAEEERARGLHGVRIAHVLDGTPADRDGLRINDLVTHVNDKPIHDAESLTLEVGRKPVESVVSLTVRRGGSSQRIQVALAKFPVRGPRITTSLPPAWRGLRIDYSTALADGPNKLRQNDRQLLREGCVVITEVERDSPAWEAKLQPGMFVSAVSGKKVTTPKDFRLTILGKDGPVDLKVFGGDQPAGAQTRVIKPDAGR
jgi:S1-C subfamily serine protease